MTIRSEKPIYSVLEKHLRSAAYPMTCTMLMDISEVRETVLDEFSSKERDVRVASNKLSDTLGFLWRRASRNMTFAARWLRTLMISVRIHKNCSVIRLAP